MSLPERINVIKTFTYDVPSVIESLREMGEEDIDLPTILGYIDSWVEEDFGGFSGLVYQDEDGNEL